jgi:hypothetical protein
MLPMFHGERMRAYEDTVCEIGDALAAEIAQRCADPAVRDRADILSTLPSRGAPRRRS